MRFVSVSAFSKGSAFSASGYRTSTRSLMNLAASCTPVRHSQGHQRRGAPCEVYLWPQFTRPSNLCPSPVASTQSTGAAAIGRHKGTHCDAGCRMVPTCIGSGDCTCTLQTPEATACGRGRLQSCRATASAPNIRLQLASDSSRRQCQELQVHGTQLRIRWRQCGT